MPVRSWPDDFPPACPPEDATPPNGQVRAYRGVHNNPPSATDFVPLARSNPEKRGDCQAYGLSLFASLEDIERVRGRLRRTETYWEHIAMATLTEGVSKLTNIKRGHITWWVLDPSQVHVSFAVVDSDEDGKGSS